MTWPLATTLSATPAATSGQVNVTPPEVTCPPGMIPASASAVAEKLFPYPSKSPGAWSLSAVTPTLSNASASDPYGMVTCRYEPGAPVTSTGTVTVAGDADTETATVSADRDDLRDQRDTARAYTASTLGDDSSAPNGTARPHTGSTLADDSSAPNGTVPNGTVPNGTVPNGTVPNGTDPGPRGPSLFARLVARRPASPRTDPQPAAPASQAPAAQPESPADQAAAVPADASAE